MNEFEIMADRLRFIAKSIENNVVLAKAQNGKDGKDDKLQKLFRNYKLLLNKLRDRDTMAKLETVMDNPRLKKQDLYWAKKFDKSNATGKLDIDDFLKNLKSIYRRKLPVANFMKKLLDYGLENGHLALSNMLKRKRVRMELLGEDKN